MHAVLVIPDGRAALTNNNHSNVDTHHIQTAKTHCDQEQVEESIVSLSNTIPNLHIKQEDKSAVLSSF